MRLIDPELNLNIDLPFDPLLLPENPMWGQEVADGAFVAGNISGTEFHIEKGGVLHGQCRLYYLSKKVKGEMFYSEGVLHGPSTFFSENGNVLSSSWFAAGKQEGKCFWYYSDGLLYSLQRFENGVRHGKQEYFFRDGKVKRVITYIKGKLAGMV